MIRIFSATILALTLIACSSQPRFPEMKLPAAQQRPAFPEAEYAALAKSGNSSVTGQAFLKTRGGDVKTAAGETVYLNPVTSYSTHAFNASRSSDRRPLAAPDPRLFQYMKSTVADATGRFNFKAVPPGEYYVITQVTWQAATGYKFALQTQGGAVGKRITVKDGEVVEVMVTE